jgi:hypothetical protein
MHAKGKVRGWGYEDKSDQNNGLELAEAEIKVPMLASSKNPRHPIS